VAQKTGWLEKWQKGRVLSILEVQFHRVQVKKTPRKKVAKKNEPAHRDTNLYYVLDKKVSLGQLSLTGNSVFAPKEIVEVELPVNKTKYQTRLRLLGKITKTTSFMELKRIVFRGDIQFAAVNKEDFDLLLELEDRRIKEEAQRTPQFKSPAGKNSGLKVTFKRD
jgi:hypothetical protein